MKEKILVTTSTFAELDSTPIKMMEKAGYEVTLNPYKRKLTKEESLQLLPGYVGLIAGLETLDEEVLSKSNLKVISRCGTGMSNVDLESAKRLGIEVRNTPDGPTQAVAELTLGCLLNLLRHISVMDQDAHQGKWTKKTGSQLQGKTVVIVGFGRIGQRLAQLLGPFDVNIIIVDPYAQEKKISFPIYTLEKALTVADVMTFHCSGEESILSSKEFALLKKGAFILNAARGNLICEQSLIQALDKGIVAGAWLDTFSQEPYAGSLRKCQQVLMTPHVGSYTKECRASMELEAAQNLISTLANEIHNV